VRELVEAVDQKIPARTIARYGSLIQPFASPNHPTVSFSADKGCLIFALSPTGHRGLLRISNPRPAG
jgi:hypothetical protein